MGELLIELVVYLSIVYGTYPLFLRMVRYVQSYDETYQMPWDEQARVARQLAWIWPVGLVMYVPLAMRYIRNQKKEKSKKEQQND